MKPNTHCRFFSLEEVSENFDAPQSALQVLLLADDLNPAGVVQDHIRSIREGSKHTVTVVNSVNQVDPGRTGLDEFDVILIHYSIFLIFDSYLSTGWRELIKGFGGVVAVIHEDEYQKVDAFKSCYAELGVQALFSCLDNVRTLERVYGGDLMPHDTLFFSCLPGYIPAHLMVNTPPKTRDRPFDVVYRGRTLAPELGRLGQEKRLIGEFVQSVAPQSGLRCDISSDEHDRIYGEQWPVFLASGKAMLGVEGGSTIFDFDGQISTDVADYRAQHPGAQFEEIWQAVLRDHEGNIDFRTITPKFFEAIAAKTVLVLYPGNYNNLLVPDRHYIPLERDGSNWHDVATKLKDDEYLQAMADRTFNEIVCRPELQFDFYIDQIDRVLWTLARQLPTAKELRSRQHAHSLLLKNKKLATENQISCDEIARAKITRIGLETDLTSVTQQYAQARQEIQALESQLVQATQQNAQTRQEVQHLESQLAQVTQKNLHTRQEVQHLESQLTQATQQNEHTRQEIRNATSQISILNSQMHSGRFLLKQLVRVLHTKIK